MEVEQTETTEQTQNEGVSRDDLLAAVREAGGTQAPEESTEEAPAKAAEGAPAGEEKKPDGEPVDPDEPKVAALLRAREKAWKERQAADTYAAQKTREAEERAQQIIAEAKAKAEREHQEWLEEQRRKILDSPTEAVRALAPGGDTQKLVDAVITDNTPEARALREVRQELAEVKKGTAEATALKKQIEDIKAEAAREKQEALVTQVRTEFFRDNATKEKAPYLHARYDEDELFARANALGMKWQNEGLTFGVDFNRDDVVAVLEHESKKRYMSMNAPQQVSGAAPDNGAGKRPQGSANGSRTLSAAAGSERRSTPKPQGEMSPSERRQDLIDAVAAVRRTLPKDSTP